LAKAADSVLYPTGYVRLLLSISIGFVFFALLSAILCLKSDERKAFGKWITDQAKGFI
jgi:hypothetical protein